MVAQHNDGKGAGMDARDLEAADRLTTDLMWEDFDRIFGKPSLEGMLVEIERQLTYPSLSPLPMAAPKRSLFRRIFSRKA
jgi:hypothetical protein